MDKPKPEISIDEIIERIRQEARSRAPASGWHGGGSADTASHALNTAQIESLISTVESKSQVRMALPGKLNKFPVNRIRFLQRLILKGYELLFRDQRVVNFSLAQAFRESLAQQRQLYDQLVHSQKQTRTMQEQLGAMQEQMRAMQDKENYLSHDMFQHKKLVSDFLQEVHACSPQQLSPEQLQKMGKMQRDRALDALYAAFEDRFRGSREEIKKRLQVYLPVIQQNAIGSESMPILDVACGRGEWLELLKQEGACARGVDLNYVLVAKCREHGLDVIESDIFAYLEKLPDSSLGALTGFHIIEHLSFEDLLKLVQETVRLLKPGGVVIFETPNPRNLLVGSGDFYRDPTHRNPIHPDTISFLLAAAGLTRVASYFFTGEAGNMTLSDAATVKFDELADYVSVSRDFCVIGYQA